MFDERKKQSEKKFQLDAEKKFKIISLRNKYIGLWAAEKLGLQGEDIVSYTKEVIISDLEEAGDQDIINKILSDFTKKNLEFDENVIREKLSFFYDKALTDYKN